MEKKYYIYAHINPVKNEIFYIGKGKDKRATLKDGRSKFWKNIVNKYGYNIEILEDNLSEGVAFEREIYHINRIGRRDLGLGTLVNLTDGGEGRSGCIISEETRKKISENNARGFLGKKHSEENKKMMGVQNIGNTYASGERSDEFKKECSNRMKGKASPMKDKKHSEMTKNKMSKSKIGQGNKTVYKYDMNGNLIDSYKSLNEAAEMNSTTINMIGRVCRGIRNKHKDYKWSY